MLEKIRNLFGDKTIKLAALLALGSVSEEANALVNNNIDNQSKTEEAIRVSSDSSKLNHDQTYTVTKVDTAKMMNNKESSEVIRIDFNVDYKTDQADFNEKYRELIINKFSKFLANINKDNFNIVNKSAWQVFSSCDERETNAWGQEGNKALAEARGAAVIKVLEKVLSNYQFQSLKEQEINILRNKKITNQIASTHPDREGETLISDRINPATNQKYTDQEVQELKSNNPDKYFSLLSENRISEFRAEIPVKKNLEAIKDQPSEISLIDKNELVKQFTNYKNIVLLLDNSPSMDNNIQQLNYELSLQKNNSKNSNIFVGEYSASLQTIHLVENIDSVEEEVTETIGEGGNKELSVQAVVAAWEQIKNDIKPTDKTLILVMTDEALQDVSAEDLAKLAELPKNVEIKFDFCLDNGQDLEVPLVSVQHEFNIQKDKINQEIELKINNLKSDIQYLEQRLIVYHKAILRIQSQTVKEKHYKKKMKEIKKTISDLEIDWRRDEDRLEKLYKKFNNIKKVTLREIKLKNGETIHLNVY